MLEMTFETEGMGNVVSSHTDGINNPHEETCLTSRCSHTFPSQPHSYTMSLPDGNRFGEEVRHLILNLCTILRNTSQLKQQTDPEMLVSVWKQKSGKVLVGVVLCWLGCE